VGIDQRTLTTSIVISACVSAALLLLFSSMASKTEQAEAATRTVTRPIRAEENPTVRQDIARKSLQQRIQAIADNLVTPSGHLNQRAVRALRAQGPAVVPVLLGRFTGEETAVQEGILMVLGDSGEAAVTERLLDVLESGVSPPMAVKIGTAIRTQGDAVFCKRLEGMVTAESPAIRLAAAVALGTCPSRTAAVALVRLVKSDDDENVRTRALASLKASHPAFLEQALTFSLLDSSPRVRLAAVRVVEEHRCADFADELRGLLKHDPAPSVKRAARRALGALR
jgi:HEAT repeat protein